MVAADAGVNGRQMVMWTSSQKSDSRTWSQKNFTTPLDHVLREVEDFENNSKWGEIARNMYLSERGPWSQTLTLAFIFFGQKTAVGLET